VNQPAKCTNRDTRIRDRDSAHQVPRSQHTAVTCNCAFCPCNPSLQPGTIQKYPFTKLQYQRASSSHQKHPLALHHSTPRSSTHIHCLRSVSNTHIACTTAPLNHCTTAPLYHCTTVSLYHCTTVSLHHCITASLHHCITASLHQFTTAPLHHCTTAPLHH
jgi:hypothetical protein